jgi:hypothetical protein
VACNVAVHQYIQEDNMSALSRAQEFLTETNDLTAKSVVKQFEIQRDVAQALFNANRERLEAFRNVKGLTDVVSIERKYLSAVAEQLSDSVKAQTELGRESAETLGRITRRLFSQDVQSA